MIVFRGGRRARFAGIPLAPDGLPPAPVAPRALARTDGRAPGPSVAGIPPAILDPGSLPPGPLARGLVVALAGASPGLVAGSAWSGDPGLPPLPRPIGAATSPPSIIFPALGLFGPAGFEDDAAPPVPIAGRIPILAPADLPYAASIARAPTVPDRVPPPAAGEVIMALWRSSPFLMSAMPGGLWDRVAGTDTPVPYGTYAVLSRSHRRLMGRRAPVYETDNVQITLFGATDRTVEDLYRLWTDPRPFGLDLDRGIPPGEIPGLDGRDGRGVIAWIGPDRPAIGPNRLRDFAGPKARDLWMLTFEIQLVVARPRLA